VQLFIAEKPSAAKAIADALGNAKRKDGYYECGDTRISYCVGHLFEQQPPDAYLSDDIPKNKKGNKVWRLEDLPIVPETWQYKAKSKTKDQLTTLGKLIKDADEVVNAGDLDREGQAIIDHVLEHFECSVPVKRFCVSAQDPVSIKRGLDDLRDNKDYRGWRDAALARQRADWLVGMNLSRSFTLEAQAKGDRSLLVVGRVQSPTLALVVARDRIIENFKAKDFYSVEATIAGESGEFKAKWIPESDSRILDEENRIIDKAAAERATSDLENTAGIISLFETEAKKTPQPLGLSLSDVTLLASNKYGYSADDILATVQSLYETHKLVSYPRSDCRYLPESQFDDARDVLKAIGDTDRKLREISATADPKIKSRIFSDAKITAHHGIVPTQLSGDIAKLSEKEARLYDIIARRYVAQFYPQHEFDQTNIVVKTEIKYDGSNPYLLKASGRVVTSEGWKCVYKSGGVDEDTEGVQLLPNKPSSLNVTVKNGEYKSKKTTPPKYFTEGTLIKALEQIHKYIDNDEYKKLLREEDGIGTSATRSGIITELKRREYLLLEGKSLKSSSLGRRLIDTLPEPVKSPVLTAKYERDLTVIQNDNGSMDDFVNNQISFVREQIAIAGDLIAKNPVPVDERQTDDGKAKHPCPDCGQPLIRRKNTFKKTGFWWGCSAHPACKSTFPDKRAKPDLKTIKPEATETEHVCAKCESPLIKRTSAKGVDWYGCSGFPKCKQRYFDKNGSPDF